DFMATPQTTCTGQVAFTDASTNAPTSWLWNFGDGNTSTQRNPNHTYAAPGNYTVSLTAGNSFGTNVATKTNYISFDPNNPICRDINMPVNGTTITTTSCTGNLYDDGGPNNIYSAMADGAVVIAPPGANRV